MKILGRHILGEFFECDYHILNDAKYIELYMKRAALECGATIINSTFHRFNPHGVSGVVVIAESHLAIHTWPEHKYAAIDVFTCGDWVNPLVATQALQKMLKSNQVKIIELDRGELTSANVLTPKSVAIQQQMNP